MCGGGRRRRQFTADVLLMTAVASFVYMQQDGRLHMGAKREF